MDHQINGEGGTAVEEHVHCNYTNIISKHIAVCCAVFQAKVSHLKGVLDKIFFAFLIKLHFLDWFSNILEKLQKHPKTGLQNILIMQEEN